MIRRPPISPRTDTIFPYTTLFRSVTARNMADRIGHVHDGQTESERTAQQSYADIGKGGGENRAAAAAENEPERADELGQTLLDIRHDAPHPRRRPLTPPARVRSEERRVGKECVRTC